MQLSIKNGIHAFKKMHALLPTSQASKEPGLRGCVIARYGGHAWMMDAKMDRNNSKRME